MLAGRFRGVGLLAHGLISVSGLFGLVGGAIWLIG